MSNEHNDGTDPAAGDSDEQDERKKCPRCGMCSWTDGAEETMPVDIPEPARHSPHEDKLMVKIPARECDICHLKVFEPDAAMEALRSAVDRHMSESPAAVQAEKEMKTIERRWRRGLRVSILLCLLWGFNLNTALDYIFKGVLSRPYNSPGLRWLEIAYGVVIVLMNALVVYTILRRFKKPLMLPH